MARPTKLILSAQSDSKEPVLSALDLMEIVIPEAAADKAFSILQMENEKLRLENKELLAELTHTKQVLERLDIANIIRPMSDEEEITAIQLEKLKLISRERAFTLEEAKLFDIYVKNKHLVKEKIIDVPNKALKATPKKDLIKIAAKKS